MRIVGAIFGVLLLLGAGAILYGVEHLAITTAAGLEQGAGSVMTVDSGKVDPANEGKLVHLTGEAVAGGLITDPRFGISAKALRLVRETEAFAWKETKTEKKKDSEKTVTYTYDGAWSHAKPASSKSFNTPKGHENPSDKPYADESFEAADVQMGAFTLTPAQGKQIPAKEALPLSEDLLATLPEDLKGTVKVTGDGWLFIGTNPEGPKVGDARIRYKVAKPQTVTVIAKQTGNTFAPYPTGAGGNVDLIKPGAHTAQAMFEAAQSSNKLVNWVLRGISLALLTFGIFLLLRAIASSSAGGDPGAISFNFWLAVFATGYALAVALMVVGARWLLHQPLMGGGILGGGLVLFVLVYMVTRSEAVGLGR